MPFPRTPHLALSVDAERMTSLMREFPDALNLMTIQLQGKFGPLKNSNCCSERDNTSCPARGTLGQEGKMWAWGDITPELIKFGRKYGPVETKVN